MSAIIIYHFTLCNTLGESVVQQAFSVIPSVFVVLIKLGTRDSFTFSTTRSEIGIENVYSFFFFNRNYSVTEDYTGRGPTLLIAVMINAIRAVIELVLLEI